MVFAEGAGEETRRLLGALSTLRRERWPEIGTALRETMYAMSSSEMLTLDSQLHFLASTDRDQPPQSLLRLIAQLRKFPRNYSAIEREEKDYVLEAAFFLNDLFTILERVKRVYTEMPEDQKLIIQENLTHVWGIISDFRLKDFKRKRPWEG